MRGGKGQGRDTGPAAPRLSTRTRVYGCSDISFLLCYRVCRGQELIAGPPFWARVRVRSFAARGRPAARISLKVLAARQSAPWLAHSQAAARAFFLSLEVTLIGGAGVARAAGAGETGMRCCSPRSNLRSGRCLYIRGVHESHAWAGRDARAAERDARLSPCLRLGLRAGSEAVSLAVSVASPSQHHEHRNRRALVGCRSWLTSVRN